MTILDTIVETKKLEVEQLSSIINSDSNFEKRSFYEAINTPTHPLGIIAEVKKASPSKGVLLKDFDPVFIAKTYEEIGADAISVLTDQKFFQGHRDYLTKIKQHVSLPILRKDFIIHEKQVLESKEMGADAILLIAAILEKNQLVEYYEMAESLKLDVLIEVHNEEELEKVLSAVKPKMIGVNNRDLKTFKTSLETSKRLSSLMPDCLFISESGVKTRDDVNYLRDHTKINGLLVGEAFMIEPNKKRLLSSWFQEEVNIEAT